MFDVVSSSKWPTGYLINPNVEPLDPKWLTEFSKIPAAAVSDCLGRNVAASASSRSMAMHQCSAVR